MPNDLESPFVSGKSHWDALYRARGDEVSPARPIFTGDVFAGLKLSGRTGNTKSRTVMVIQHPCSMRTNGVDLAWQVLVAEVGTRREFREDEWLGNLNLMPLPDLRPDVVGAARHQAADFDCLYTVDPALLTVRCASLSPFGVNLALQRWVHYSTRVVVPTAKINEQTIAHYEEADLVEEWCDDANRGDLRSEFEACVAWLREDRGGTNYQEMLKNPQNHSTIRRALRSELAARRTPSTRAQTRAQTTS